MILVYPSEATTDVGNYLSIRKLNMEFPLHMLEGNPGDPTGPGTGKHGFLGGW